MITWRSPALFSLFPEMKFFRMAGTCKTSIRSRILPEEKRSCTFPRPRIGFLTRFPIETSNPPLIGSCWRGFGWSRHGKSFRCQSISQSRSPLGRCVGLWRWPTVKSLVSLRHGIAKDEHDILGAVARLYTIVACAQVLIATTTPSWSWSARYICYYFLYYYCCLCYCCCGLFLFLFFCLSSWCWHASLTVSKTFTLAGFDCWSVALCLFQIANIILQPDIVDESVQVRLLQLLQVVVDKRCFRREADG